MFNTSQNQLNTGQLRLLKDFARELAETGINFYAYDTELHIIINNSGEKFISDYEATAALAKQTLDSQTGTIHESGENGQYISCNLIIDGLAAATIIIDCGHDYSSKQLIKQILRIFVRSFQNDIKNAQQIELISGELAQTYEELMLLYKMSTNMRVSQPDSNFLQLACDSLIEIVRVEGIAIFLEKKINDNKKLVLTAGTGLLAIDHKDENTVNMIFGRLLDAMAAGNDVMTDTEVNGLFRYEWNGRIRNILAVPLTNNSNIIGIMVATNLLDKNDFDKNDLKMFTALATECGVFIGNHNLFKDLKKLLIGALKALVSSIDAKDQYTRGHSERVAIISKWIAEYYSKVKNLNRDDIQKIYLAGLLHDIGKIGIPETVLRKPGKLTNEEYQEIKTHPIIGAGILSEIDQMKDIVPGILHHHERFDGKGYPRGLAGNHISLAGKIVMIADSFDAMTSHRTYHNAMMLGEAVVEIEKGLGVQFDPVIGGIFLKSDLDKLWDLLQNGQNNDVYSENINDYGTLAIGTLIN